MRHTSTVEMRDRRNTNLSVSSTESNSSDSRNSLNEKRYSSPPPPSPTLPAPVTKENRPRPTLWRRTLAARIVMALCGLFLLWRFVLGWPLRLSSAIGSHSDHIDADTELVGSHSLPDEPTALMVSGPDGRSRWTVSIPHNSTFPLSSWHYRDMCKHGDGLRSTIETNSHVSQHWWRKPGHLSHDQTYLDVTDAEKSGTLPAPEQNIASEVCETSLTFVLESSEASFGKTLLYLWLSYGLAKHENRAFFIDDSRWAWGKYSSYFAPPPVPSCTQPPPHHIVPCPRNAKHLVVSSATAPWTFGSAFQEEFHSRRKHASRIYDLLRTGYQALFKLTGEDAVYATSRIAKLKADALAHGHSVVGMQIRRGDRHPFEFQYNRDYLPLERYADAAKSLASSGALLVASDDPDIFNSYELQQAVLPLGLERAQERIQLATKAALDQSSPAHAAVDSGSPYIKHVDENSGWEGGFYSALFYSMGGAKTQGTATSSIPDQALRLRELVGRAYLMDLAVLGAGDGVVCAVSSASCRVLGVMMGWDAVREGRWMNVDDGRGWSWDGRR